jgi:hypothetical protein
MIRRWNEQSGLCRRLEADRPATPRTADNWTFNDVPDHDQENTPYTRP